MSSIHRQFVTRDRFAVCLVHSLVLWCVQGEFLHSCCQPQLNLALPHHSGLRGARGNIRVALLFQEVGPAVSD